MTLPPFRNEPYTDFTLPANRAGMEAALARVRGLLGRDYPLFLAGERIETGDRLVSTNPAQPGEVIGNHAKATPELATRAVETSFANFLKWSRTLRTRPLREARHSRTQVRFQRLAGAGSRQDVD